MTNARNPEKTPSDTGTISRPNLDISLLGAFRVNLNGEKLSFPRRKTMALFAYLVLTGQPHTRESLMLLLWPDEETGLARSNLRRVLSELNSLLGKDVLSIQRDQVDLSPHLEFYVDATDFKHKVVKARQHQHDSQVGCPECLADLAKAAELYIGDLLAGFSLPDSRSFDEWQFFETESLRQLLIECLQTLVNWHTNLGDFVQAIEYGRRFLALDPLHEPAHRLLMHLYVLSGRQAAALRQYQECVQLLRKEVGIKPEPETIALYEAIRSRKITPVIQEPAIHPPPFAVFPDSSPPGRLPNNLSHVTAPMIGRKDELAKILDWIGRDTTCRLVTLTGPGGSGKTRLAIEAAMLLAGESTGLHQHGIWFVSLTPVTTAGGILDKIAQTLNLPIPKGSEQTRLMLLDFLRPKRMVLFFDNFEHLIDAESIALVIEILAAAPDVKILLTSRERLHIRDEQIVQLSGLRTPSASAWRVGDSGNSYEAVQMFAQCAARHKPGFEINPDNLPAVSQICCLVEGMPLGLELAAAWVEVLSLDEIAAEIERSLDFLEADWRDLPERQHSLRAVFESSWTLLTESERQVLVVLAVFHGGFTRLSAESTTGVSLKMLLALTHKSWINQAESGRYSIHELLRQYLSEKLHASPDVHQKFMENYSSYFASFLEGQAVDMRGSNQRQAIEAISPEYENILVAWEWLVNHKQVPSAVERMLPALFFYCNVRNKGIEFTQMAEHAGQVFQADGFESAYPTTLLILLIAQRAFNYLGFPNYPDIVEPSPFQRDALHKTWSLAEPRETLSSLGFWGIVLAYFYGRSASREVGIESLRWLSDHFRGIDLHWEEALALFYMGTLQESGELTEENEEQMLDASQQALSEAVRIFDQLGDLLQCGYSLGKLGDLSYRKNDRQQAIQYWLSAREKLQLSGDRSIAVQMLVNIGEAYIDTCEFESGFQYFQTGAVELLEMGYVNESAIVYSKEALYASRYSTFQHARRVREQSLELSYQQNDTFGIAWHSWEMGELWRLEGDALSARRWYDRSVPLFEEYGDRLGGIFYQRGLGDLAYAAGSFTEAQAFFQESLRLAEHIKHEWAMAYARAGLGRVETSLGRFETAIDHFDQGYLIARKLGNIELMLVVLVGLAALCAATEENEKAAYLARLVIQQRKSWNETKTQAENILLNLGIEQKDFLQEQDCICSSSVFELEEMVSKIEVQFTSQWHVNCT